MEFLEVVGSRRSIRWFKTWEKVPREKIQRILEAVRLTTCPGNLQPWRAIVVERDALDEKTRDGLLGADNWQGAHTQAPVWIYWYADPSSARPEASMQPHHRADRGGRAAVGVRVEQGDDRGRHPAGGDPCRRAARPSTS